MDNEKKPVCTLCGRDGEKVNKILAIKPGFYVCDQCINLCKEILDEEIENDEEEANSENKLTLKN